MSSTFDQVEFERNKLLLSIWKKVNTKVPLQPAIKPDISTIVCLLKAIGFYLEKFDKQDIENTEEIEKNTIKITLQCGSSDMQAILKTNDVNCQCPNPEKQNGSFWSVTGNNVNKIEETGSTLLPDISKEKNFILQTICQSLFEVIEEKNTFDPNMSSSSVCSAMMHSDQKDQGQTMTRSSTQPEITVNVRPSLPANYKLSDLVSNSSIRKPLNESYTISSSSLSSASDSSKTRLPIRQDTYDVEPIESVNPDSKIPEIVYSNLSGSLERLSFRGSDQTILQYVLTNLKDIEKVLTNLKDTETVIKNYMERPTSSSQLSLNDESFQRSKILTKSYTTNSIKRNTYRPGSTSSQGLSRSSTMIKDQKSSTRKSIGISSRVSTTPLNKSSLNTSKTPANRNSLSTLKPSTLSQKGRPINSPKSSAEKRKSIVSLNERSISTPRKRVSDIGIANSIVRNTSTSGKSTALKSPILSTQTNTSSKFGYKKN